MTEYTYNDSLLYNLSISYFFNSDMYTECAEKDLYLLYIGKGKLNSNCDYLISFGGVTALLMIPTVLLAIILNVIIGFGFLYRLRLSAKQEIYGMFYVVINSINLLFTGIAINFLGKGLPWLGFKGIYIEYAFPLSCKLCKFLQMFLNCSLINILLCEVIGRLIYLLSYGAHSPDVNYIIYILVGTLFSSVFLCYPIIMLYNLQKPDGRYDCIPDPAWSYSLIRWHSIHRMIFCDGLMQSILILVMNGFIIFQLLKFRWTIASIKSSYTESNIVSDTLKQVVRLLNNNARDSILVVIHSTIIVLLFFVRSIVSYMVYKVIFIDFLDNTTVDGALLNYKWTAVEDFLTFLHMLFISCYTWLYFFIIPPFRTYIRKAIKRISHKNSSVLQVIDLFMLADHELAESPEVWKKSQDYLENLDSVLFERIRQLEGALKYNSNFLLLKSQSHTNVSNKLKYK